MTLDEFYKSVGGSLEETLRRLPSERLIVKYLGLFESDDSYSRLCDEVAAHSAKGIFEASHSLKGVAANLGLENLRAAASDICENCRDKEPDDSLNSQFEAVKVAYDKTKQAICDFLASQA